MRFLCSSSSSSVVLDLAIINLILLKFIMVLVSVILPVYNGQKHLKEAIDSILTQSLTDFELIIINDGSTDNSKSIIDQYDDKRIIYVEQENKGLAKALNVGASYCKGDFIARMDADDISHPERFMKQYLFFRSHAKISVLATSFSYIDKNGKYLGRSFSITHPFLIKKKLLNSGSVVCHPSVMMRRKDFLDVGGYSEIMGNRFTDYHLWVKFVKNDYKIKIIPEALLKYRITEDAVSSEFSLTPRALKLLIMLVNKEDEPSPTDLSNLNNSCITSSTSFLSREKLYNNHLNDIYNRASFINENVKNVVFSAYKNIAVAIRLLL